MFIKQIDLETALNLAAKGQEVLTLDPNVPDPEKWTDYSPGTLQGLLNGCLFFRREPALEKLVVEELPRETENGNPPPGLYGPDPGFPGGIEKGTRQKYGRRRCEETEAD